MQIEEKKLLIEGRLVRVGRLDAEGYDYLDDPVKAVESLRLCGKRIDLFTFTEKLENTEQRYRFPVEIDNTAVLEISTFDEWMSTKIDFKTRNKVRKAAKLGVVVKEVELDDRMLLGISRIYNETPVRQGRKFPHYKKDIESLRQMKLTFAERSIFIGAFLEDELIGFIKMVHTEDKKQAGLMHILSMVRHRDKAPTNALVAQAVRSCAERCIPRLFYAKFSYGRKLQDSLADFKRHNGFRKVDVPRYYVPLTRWGRIAYQLGLHQNIAEIMPEAITSKYRKMRADWYAKKFAGVEPA
jgi:hypothetical protein